MRSAAENQIKNSDLELFDRSVSGWSELPQQDFDIQPIVCNKNTHAFLPNFQQSSTSSHSMSILLLSCRSGNLQKLVLTTESIPLFGSIQNPCLH